MQTQRTPLLSLVGFLAGLGCVRISAAEFRGQVLDRDSKQPVAAVVVQEFSMLGLGPGDRRIITSAYTNAHGQFRLPVPDGIDARNLSLIVTRKAGATQEAVVGGNGLLMTSFKNVIGIAGHPSTQKDNVIYANLSPRKKPS